MGNEEEFDNELYLQYIATRPGVATDQQPHGLFGKLSDMNEMGDIKDLELTRGYVQNLAHEKKTIQSIKSGHDFTSLIDDAAYTKDFSNELGTATKFKAYNSNGQRILTIKDVDMRFIIDKTLKSNVTYTLNYQFYFMSQPLFSKDIEVKLESRYNLKY